MRGKVFFIFSVLVLVLGWGRSGFLETLNQKAEIPLFVQDRIGMTMSNLLSSVSASSFEQDRVYLLENSQATFSRLTLCLTSSRSSYRMAAYQLSGLLKDVPTPFIVDLALAMKGESQGSLRALALWALSQLGARVAEVREILQEVLEKPFLDKLCESYLALCFDHMGAKAGPAIPALIQHYILTDDDMSRRNLGKALEHLWTVTKDERIQKLKWVVRLNQQLYFQSHLCYRPEVNGIDESVDADDLETYYQELKPVHLSLLLDNAQSDSYLKKRFHSVMKRYPTEKILACAKRNFTYLTQFERAWHGVLSRFGSEGKNVFEFVTEAPQRKELNAKFQRAPLILIGNNHSVESQGQLLFDFTQSMASIDMRVKGIMMEAEQGVIDSVSTVSKMLKEENCSLEDVQFRMGDFKRSFLKKLYACEDQFKLINQAREWIYLSYHTAFPELELVSIDFCEKRPSLNQVIDVSKLKTCLASTDVREKWLAYYGESHVLKHQLNQDFALMEQAQIDPFTISQLASSFQEGAQVVFDDLGLISHGYYLMGVYGYPSHPTRFYLEEEPLHLYTALKFASAKFQSRRANFDKPYFVDLVGARKAGLLYFLPQEELVDLLVMQPEPIDASRSYVEEDRTFHQLKAILTEELPTLLWPNPS
ncbi:MAG: hypothetical protein HY390_04050 [Deltaproteobacteria bacterium]|nr:hypothetical protein [Deltaproteobacteria bacterium]